MRSRYLFLVRALSRTFRGHVVAALRAAATDGTLARVTRPGEIDAVLDTVMGKEWVVYSTPCPGRAETVVDYLGRYTHRIAISDERIVAASDTHVSFRCKDYRQGGARRTLTLETDEFIRRYLLHVLRRGLMRVRHYGFLSNRCRRRRLPEIREAIGVARTPAGDKPMPTEDPSSPPCSRCRTGRLKCRRQILSRGPIARLTEG